MRQILKKKWEEDAKLAKIRNDKGDKKVKTFKSLNEYNLYKLCDEMQHSEKIYRKKMQIYED